MAGLGAVLVTGCGSEPQKDLSQSDVPSTPPRESTQQPTWTLPDRVTYAEHVAPILYTHCSQCHRVGEAGLFL